MSGPILSTHGLTSGYGDFQALFGIDFGVDAGEVVALIGANGAGKSTFLRTIMGLLPARAEMVRFKGQPVGGSLPDRMVRQGVAMIPEGRRLFTGMSIEDNLRVAMDHARKVDAREQDGLWTLERCFQLFPDLRARRRQAVESLSGGQQQMVAIARALLNQPRVLLCDELSLGLAPRVIAEIYAILPEIALAGTAIVIVEQDVALAMRASRRCYCMLEGRITLEGASDELQREAVGKAYFGSGHGVA